MKRKTNPYMTHRRRKKIENYKKTNPSRKSTGPKTNKGKTVSSQNAMKHGARSRPMRDLEKALSLQNKFLKSIRHPELVSGSISSILGSETNLE